MQVSSCILSKIPVPDTERRNSRVLPTTDLPSGKVEGGSGGTGAECAIGSHSHGDIDSAEIFSLWGVGVHKGKVGDSAFREVRVDR